MLDKLKGKKIAIVGLGTNNKKLADFLRSEGLEFEVVDGWKHPDDLIGKLDSFEIIFRSPGLPYLSAAIQQAKAAGTEISSQSKLFFELCQCPIIGVTGTKGKGTTSSLIAKIFKTAGKNVWLAGNIGTDPFEFIEKIKPDDVVVLELSSFQLQDLEKSPHIAVVLSITPDHLNHHQDFEEYINAKSNIVAYQAETDFAVLHPGLPEWFKNLGKSQKIILDPHAVASFETKLLGKHNLDNIAAAVEVARLLKIDDEVIKKAVAEFETLPHRLSLVRQLKGITYIDDGFSTNIEPTIAAINAVNSKIVLVIGGSEKGLDFNRVGETINSSKKVKGIVVIGDVTDKILQSLQGFEGQIFTGAKNMQEILSQANRIATEGDTVLFSPGTASFGLFKNEYDRAEQYVNAVNSL